MRPEKKLIYEGEETTISKLSELFGVSKPTILNMVKRGEIKAEILPTPKTYKKLAKEYGVSVNTVFRRKKNGTSLDKPLFHRNGKMPGEVLYNGKFASVKVHADAAGIKYITALKRIEAGYHNDIVFSNEELATITLLVTKQRADFIKLLAKMSNEDFAKIIEKTKE